MKRSRKLRFLRFNPQAALDVARQGYNLPEDVKLSAHKPKVVDGQVRIYVESESFDEVKEGGLIPEVKASPANS